MPSSPFRIDFKPIRLWCALAGGVLASVSGVCATAPEEPLVRLSGIVLVADSPKAAVIEQPIEGSRIVRIGTEISGVGIVIAISRTGMVIKTSSGVIEVKLAGGGVPESGQVTTKKAPAVGEQKTQPMAVVQVDEDMVSVIMQMAQRPSATMSELNFTLRPMLNLPPEAQLEMKGSNFEPMSSVADVKENLLDRGHLMRVMIQGVQGLDMIYLKAPPPVQAPETR